jgi:hypothetical protein
MLKDPIGLNYHSIHPETNTILIMMKIMFLEM